MVTVRILFSERTLVTLVILTLVVLAEADVASTTANISGTIFRDMNFDGIRDSIDPGLEGWIIILRNTTTGTELALIATDTNGSYKFGFVEPGEYTLEEVLQAGWFQTFPSGGTHILMLDGIDITSIDFGNFLAAPTPTLTPIPTPLPTRPTRLFPHRPSLPPNFILTPPPTPTLAPIQTITQTQPDVSKIVEEELNKLVGGRILYNPPQEMKVGEEERIEVRLTKTSTENLTEGIRGRGEPIIENISVGTLMKVHLTGDNFEVKALSDEEQIVSSENFTQWEFDVTPLQSGVQSLQLVVTVRIKLPGLGEERRNYPVFEKQINVNVNIVYSIKKFMITNWQWIFTTFIGISGIIIGLIVKKKRNSRKKK